MAKFCDNYPGWCIYVVWCIIVTVCLILYYVTNRSNLNKDEYINELKKINFIDEL
jgi:predicted metal-binding transcription factor (methanogenesis marker protein 9)